MSGKICPSLSIHHKVTRINFDRVAKALAVLLGYPGHGNKKTSWISEQGVFFFVGGSHQKKGKTRKTTWRNNLERSSWMDFGLGAPWLVTWGWFWWKSSTQYESFKSSNLTKQQKEEYGTMGSKFGYHISTRLNHLNIFIMGSCSNQKEAG